MKKSYYLLLWCYFFSTMPSFSQESIKVFLDCQSFQYNCFEDYLKTEISFVEFVRDRKLANVHILPTYIQTATGGTKVQLSFMGRAIFQGKNDTLIVIREMNNTDSEYRSNLLMTIKAGLISYLAKINKLDIVSITPIKTNKDSTATLRKESEKKDPWNYWVFRAGFGGYGMGDNIYSTLYSGGNFSASRTTEKFKVDISFSNNLTKDRYTYQENGEEKVINNKQVDYVFSSNLVKSLTKKWSYGGFLEARTSVFKNYKYQIIPSVGVEYDVFPYSKYNDKYILLRYTMGTVNNKYNNTTIYDQNQEHLFEQKIGIYSTFVQKWGNIASSVTWQNFMNDFKKNSVGLYVSANITLAKSLNLSFGGTFSSIHNQINLAKGGASTEDVLIKRRQLATSFSYFAGAGISYTFGSIYNNVVNPRFNTMYNNISLNW